MLVYPPVEVGTDSPLVVMMLAPVGWEQLQEQEAEISTGYAHATK
jgi:hypothetical protein